MLDGLLKSKFYSRCKSDIKQTKIRIELINKKRNAMQKYLRKDVADLLKNGLDTNAYGRAEGLLNELNRSSCFEFVDQCCVTIANNLGTMDKQRECPQECREAVASLMFAAARLAELPELRQLRTLFSERYMNSLDFYVNKQFTEKLNSGHPSKEMKLQLLQDIAAASGLEWSSKALENELYHEAAGKKDIADDFNDKLRMDGSVPKNESRNRSDYVRWNPGEWAGPERKDSLSCYEQKYRSEDVPTKDIQVDTIVRNKSYNQPESRVPNEEKHEEKPLEYRSIPPPYLKPNAKKTTSEEKVDRKETDDQDYPTVKAKPVRKSVRRRPLQSPPAHKNSVHYENEEKSKETNKEQAAAQGQRILKFLDKGDTDEQDEEEKMMDQLLLHYSRKNAPRGTVQSDSNIKLPPDHDPGHSSKATKHRSRDVPNRLSSLPGELTSPTSESHKGHARAFSLQPEMLNGNGHVHPKLPDYDDFVARLAALRGK